MSRPAAQLTRALIRRRAGRADAVDAPPAPAWIADVRLFATAWAAGFVMFLILLS